MGPVYILQFLTAYKLLDRLHATQGVQYNSYIFQLFYFVKSIVRIKRRLLWCVRGSEFPHVWIELIELNWCMQGHVQVRQY